MSKKPTNTCAVDAADLAAEAAWINKAVAKVTLPTFKAVQVTAEAGTLTLRRTNLELFAETVLPAAGNARCTILVDAAKLAAALKSAAGEVIVDVADDRLRLAVGGRILTLGAAAQGDEYPQWPTVTPTGKQAVLGAPQLARALTSVGTDPTLPMLTGVCFDGGSMISTDRFRLTRITYDDDGFTALVPGEALRPFARGADVVFIDPCTATEGVPWVILSGGGRSITARTLEVDFPKWRQLIPADDAVTTLVTVRREDLLAAIASTDGTDVTLTVPEDADKPMLVSVSDRNDSGVQCDQQVRTTAVLRSDGLEMKIRFNVKNLTGCLKGLCGPVVRLGALDPGKPVLLQGASDTDMHLVMPVRIPA